MFVFTIFFPNYLAEEKYSFSLHTNGGVLLCCILETVKIRYAIFSCRLNDEHLCDTSVSLVILRSFNLNCDP